MKIYLPLLAVMAVGSIIFFSFQVEDELRMYVLDTGEITATDPSALLPGVGLEEEIVMGNPSFLLVHPAGVLLWDTGLSDSLIDYPKGIEEQFARFRLEKSLVAQLAKIGYTPEKIDYLALSHMHADHTGNANLFTDAQLLLQPEEQTAAFGPSPQKYLFDARTYDQLSNIKVVDDNYDVFGDQSVIIKRAVGHSPGHQVLQVRLAETGTVLLAGDTYHTQQNKQLKLPPVFSFDSAQSVAAMHKVEAMAEEANAQIWIQHEPVLYDTVQFSPFCYR